MKRIYDPIGATDGTRVLVDRLWPRGISKQEAHIDDWPKDVTPSTELRQWYHEDPAGRHTEFVWRYRAELKGEAQTQALHHLRGLTAAGPVTLLTAAKDLEHSHAAVLAHILR